MADKRSYGTGSLSVKHGNWYGKWRGTDTRQIMRKLGPVRKPGTNEGLTRKQAEAELRRHMESESAIVPVGSRMTVERVGTRYIDHLEAIGRKRSTVADYRSYLKVHLGPYFADKTLDKIEPAHVEAFMAKKTRDGKSAKSVLNWLGLLHGIFEYGMRKGWATVNPCALVDKPNGRSTDRRLRFLDQEELDALLRATLDTDLGRTDAAMYLTAAMTGLRQGELIALRWEDVDWLAGRIRVRESFVRGEFDSPKSGRSTRSVPMADRVAKELELHSQRSPFDGDADLVFPHPHTGGPMERSRLLKRYKATLKRGGVRPVRFHDLRHTFGTRMAGAGVPMRTLQEWMGHRDFATTLIYADYSPSDRERELVEKAFRPTTADAPPDRRHAQPQGLDPQVIQPAIRGGPDLPPIQ